RTAAQVELAGLDELDLATLDLASRGEPATKFVVLGVVEGEVDPRPVDAAIEAGDRSPQGTSDSANALELLPMDPKRSAPGPPNGETFTVKLEHERTVPMYRRYTPARVNEHASRAPTRARLEPRARLPFTGETVPLGERPRDQGPDHRPRGPQDHR